MVSLLPLHTLRSLVCARHLLSTWATSPWLFSLPKAPSAHRPPAPQLLPLSEITSLVYLLTSFLSAYPMDVASMRAGSCLSHQDTGRHMLRGWQGLYSQSRARHGPG